MPIYEWRCDCGEESSTSRSFTANTQDKVCPNCGEPMNRRYGAQFHRFEEHVSPATGQVVGSQRQFREQLKRASEEATRNTGIPHNFVPMEIEKPKEGPGTESQAKKHRELGTPGFERKRSYH